MVTDAIEAPVALTSDLGWLLARASHALTTELTAALEDLGISPRAHAVLTTAMTGELTQSEIARVVGLDKTTMGVLAPDERDMFLRALGRLACGRLAEPVPCAHPVRRRG